VWRQDHCFAALRIVPFLLLVQWYLVARIDTNRVSSALSQAACSRYSLHGVTNFSISSVAAPSYRPGERETWNVESMCVETSCNSLSTPRAVVYTRASQGFCVQFQELTHTLSHARSVMALATGLKNVRCHVDVHTSLRHLTIQAV
jgi:hypothetical protein